MYSCSYIEDAITNRDTLIMQVMTEAEFQVANFRLRDREYKYVNCYLKNVHACISCMASVLSPGNSKPESV